MTHLRAAYLLGLIISFTGCSDPITNASAPVDPSSEDDGAGSGGDDAATSGAGGASEGGASAGGEGGSSEGGSGHGGGPTGVGGGEGGEGGEGGSTGVGGQGGQGGGIVNTPLDPKWDQAYVGSGQSFSQDAAIDKDGNVVVVGTFNGTLDFGDGPLSASGNDIYLLKYDSNGSLLWSKSFGDDSEPQLGAAIATDSNGNIVLAGTFIGILDFGCGSLDAEGSQFSDAYVAKLTPAGACSWSKHFGDINAQEGHSVAVDGDDSIVISGQFQNVINFGGATLSTPGHRDAFLAKFDSDGSHVFSKQFGDEQTQDASTVAVAADGTIAIGGLSQGSVDFGGGELVNSDNKAKAFVALFDDAGQHIFSDLFQGGIAQVTALAYDPNGDLLVGGNFNDEIDFGDGPMDAVGPADDIFVARYEGIDFLGALAFGDVEAQRLNDLAVDAAGFPVLAGRYRGSIDFSGGAIDSQGNYDGFVIKLDSNGSRFYSIGDASYQSVTAVVVDGDDIVTVGNFSGVVNLGSGDVGGSIDSFVATYQQ